MKIIIVLLSLVTLCSGCSSTAPTHFIVNTAPIMSLNTVTNKTINIEVTDNRARQDILLRINNGKKSYLAAQLPTTTFIKQGLITSFGQDSAVGFSPTSHRLLHINIEKMAIKLDQSTMFYETQSLVMLAVTITNGTKTLNKTFKRQGTSKGPLTADIAVLEQEFNQLIAQLFNDISQDTQVIQYLEI